MGSAHISRFIVYSKVGYYWPQETIRHCRTGRIKRGMVLKRQFGVYYPDKTRDFVALKIMEKVNETAAEQLSEIEEWDRYKHQKHDLFVSRNEAADQFIEKSNVILALENK